jgi:hypothetical protein
MGWVLGFGIPIAYLMTGFLLSRAVYRSRHKRGYNKWNDEVDTGMTCGIMVVTWPIFAPLYFATVVILGIFKTESIGSLGEKFYKHRLPLTNEQKRVQELRAQKARKDEITRLEKELGIGSE